MRAIEVARFGGPDVLQLRHLPGRNPSSGQLLISAAACDVLFVDTMIRSGAGADYFPIRPPYVPGNGVGGVVTDVGDGVDEGWLGKEVVAHTGGPGGGGYAEQAAVDVEACVALPDGVDLMEATALLHDGTTALRVLETTHVSAGEAVLVLGAAGGMGIDLVQLLTARGGVVVGAAHGQRKLDAVTQAGAVAVVDYSRPDWTRAVLDATGGERPSVVLDGVGGAIGQQAFELISDGGRFSAHGAPSGSFAAIDADLATRRAVTVTTIADLQYRGGDRSRLLGLALSELASGRLTPLIGQTYELTHAAEAHTAFEARATLAKTLLRIDPQ